MINKKCCCLIIFILFADVLYFFSLDDTILKDRVIIKKDRDETSDIISGKDQTTDSAKKIKHDISFYSKDELFSLFDSEGLITILKTSTADLSFIFYNNLYNLTAYINDSFIVDFVSVNSLSSGETSAEQDTVFINRIFSSGICNEFEIRGKFKIQLNFDFILDNTFNDFISVYPISTLAISGNYYQGFFWESAISLMPRFYLFQNIFEAALLLYHNFGYEFFRFYGPRKFRFGIDIDDYIRFKINNGRENNFSNNFKAGLYLKLFGFKPSVSFLNYYKTDYNEIILNEIGINTAFEYKIKYFKIYLAYSGTTDMNALYDFSWLSMVEFYLKFSI